MKPTNRGLDAILSIGDKIIGGQQNCILNRSASAINITNKINGDWQEYITGSKTWSLLCSGVFLKDEESLLLLEQAYNNGTPIDLKLTDGNRSYQGQAIITNFPVEAKFNAAFTYNLNLQGTGPLK